MQISAVLLLSILTGIIFREIKLAMEDNQVKDNIGMRQLIKIREQNEIIRMVIILIAIFALAAAGYIDKTITGTLIGTIVGYYFRTKGK